MKDLILKHRNKQGSQTTIEAETDEARPKDLNDYK